MNKILLTVFNENIGKRIENIPWDNKNIKVGDHILISNYNEASKRYIKNICKVVEVSSINNTFIHGKIHNIDELLYLKSNYVSFNVTYNDDWSINICNIKKSNGKDLKIDILNSINTDTYLYDIDKNKFMFIKLIPIMDSKYNDWSILINKIKDNNIIDKFNSIYKKEGI